MAEEEYEMMIKIILIGDSAVGKTNIMSRYLKGEFMESSKATIGVEFGSKIFKIDEHVIKAQIWDTAGQEKYKSITGAYYKGTKGAFIVYDITRQETFDNVDRWINELKVTADPKLFMILIGNKCDLADKREVSIEQGEEKAKSFGCAFLETSALSGDNIDKGFQMMAEEILKKNLNDDLDDDEFGTIEKGEEINLDKTKNDEAKKACC
jgi:Ras-related protein Rab-11A